MAFNWQTFRTRTLTAIIFAGVMLAGLLWNQWSFLVLFSIIHFGCWWEYIALMEKIHAIRFHPYIKLGFMLLGYGLFLWLCGPGFEINGYRLRENLPLPVSAAGFALLWIGIFQKMPVQLRSFGATAIGIAYISLSWGLVMNLYGTTGIPIRDAIYVVSPNYIPLVIIISIWINDTMAYIVGSMIGKTPLSKISPKKTWEGTTGGIILCIAVVGLVGRLLGGWKVGILFFLMIMAAVAAIAGTFGDLLESKLKRMAGVKDSGNIMPGHGGFLDRFDSLLLAVPAVWLFVAWVVESKK